MIVFQHRENVRELLGERQTDSPLDLSRAERNMTTKPRPGGRSARNKAAVFEAAAALLAERGHDAVTMTDIAERAGIAATSLYRRWGDVRALVMEVAVENLMRERPLPDTGTLRG